AAGLHPGQRTGAEACVRYLTNTGPYLDYPTALAQGWPIATGVIEGACRHLIKDRMDLTGARWSLPGAEAVLKLRALHSNGDFDDYWNYHLTQEKHRIHKACYQNGVIPHI
ncbi:MAG: ISKra4 family transposase, partial [Actinobacteria bacterium]|nr:ISKra4 family transposase [Actinomycetota bacterium]